MSHQAPRNRPAATAILGKLQCGNAGCACAGAVSRGDGLTHCPAHEDRNPSLNVSMDGDGRVLVRCHGGCTQEAVVDALRSQHLWPTPNRAEEGVPPTGTRFEHSNGLTLKDYADAKRLPLEALAGFHLSDTHVGRSAVRMPYLDTDGRELAVRFRTALTGSDRFRWRRGAKPMLYGLWRLAEARAGGSITLVEGESDCHVLWTHSVPALGLPGATSWREDWATHLDGIARINVVIEADQGGDAVQRWLATSRIRERVWLVTLPAGTKDPAALYLTHLADFPTRWARIIETAVPWADREVAERARAAAAAEAKAGSLLRAPDLWSRIAQAIAASGWAGDPTPPLIAYVAFTSRLLPTPLHLAIVAQSATGKNAALDAARGLVPPEAMHIVTAGSERALIYAEADYAHRVVVFGEADSIPDDGPAASAIRALASEYCLAYDVVERDERTGRHTTRHIRKNGPTGLITTSTRSLRAQLGTRHLEVPVPDDEDQTRKVLGVHARRVMGTPAPAADMTPFLAMQRWLELAGRRAVIVPYAAVLSALVPARMVRMRRDFRQLLTAIQTLALIHQCQRDTTDDGKIVAAIADYAMVRGLLLPIFSGIVSEGMTEVIRTTVEAVQEGEEVTQAELGRRRQIAKATAAYRVGKAIAGGWLTNLETRKGHPARLVRGVPLPETIEGLPTPERVREVFEGSNGTGAADITQLPPGSDLPPCGRCGSPTAGFDWTVGEPACLECANG